MRKKYIRIILIIIVLLLTGGGYFAWMMYQTVMGSEEISGKQGNIPEISLHTDLIEKGADDWPNWRGAGFDGKSKSKSIIKDWSEGLNKCWQVDYLCQDNATASWSAPVVQGNRLIVPGRNETHDLLFCINTNNGELLWLGSYESEAQTSHGPGPRATPFIDQDRVYSYGRSGDLTAWKLDNGQLLWRRNVKEFGGEETTWGLSSSPYVFNDKVIVQGGGNATAIAFNKYSGDVLWKSMIGDAGYSASAIINIENDTTLLIYHAMGLSCLDPENGNELWRVLWETEYGVNATTPIVKDDTIFHTSAYGMGCQLIKAGKNEYNILWTGEVMAAQHSDPVLLDGYLFGYSGDTFRNKGRFKCVEFKSGKEMWSTDEIGQGTMVYADGHLICLDLKGNLHLLKADPTSYQKLGEIKNAIEGVRHLAWTTPIIANGKLYLRYLQKLVCYEISRR